MALGREERLIPGASEKAWPGLCISRVPAGLAHNQDGQMGTGCSMPAPGLWLSPDVTRPRAMATRGSYKRHPVLQGGD